MDCKKIRITKHKYLRNNGIKVDKKTIGMERHYKEGGYTIIFDENYDENSNSLSNFFTDRTVGMKPDEIK
jgi:hypothetical protein